MARPELLVRSCPNCGARIDAEPRGGRVLCRYCGQSFQVSPEDEPAPPPPPRVVVIGPAPRRPAVPLARRVASAVFVLLVGAILIAVRFGLVSPRSASQGLLGTLPSLPLPSVPAAFFWDTVGGTPIPAVVGPAGGDGFVGRIRMRGDDTLWIAAFDGTKPSMVWKAGPFGTYSEGYRSTLASIVGREVIVTDYRANVHVYDLATGHEARSAKLSDRAKSMCTAPDGKAHVWIETNDEKGTLFNADVGTASPAPRPAWCSESAWAPGDCRGSPGLGPARVGCKDPALAPKVSGFEAIHVLEEGDAAVALGRKHPGTALPMAVGFDPKTKAQRWEHAIAAGDPASIAESGSSSSLDALAGGRFVAPYEITSKGWHFTAFDAKTGQRLWDIPLKAAIGSGYAEGLSLSPSRMYVMRSSSVEVYDAKTGAFYGAIGEP
jgi:hypothetical protein